MNNTPSDGLRSQSQPRSSSQPPSQGPSQVNPASSLPSAAEVGAVSSSSSLGLHRPPVASSPGNPLNQTPSSNLPSSSAMGSASGLGARFSRSDIRSGGQAARMVIPQPPQFGAAAAAAGFGAQGMYPLQASVPAMHPNATPSSQLSGGTAGNNGNNNGLAPPTAPSQLGEPSSTSEGAYETIIWGTSVSVGATRKLFRQFLSKFVPNHPGISSEKSYYLDMMYEMRLAGQTDLCIDAQNLKSFHVGLYHQLVSYPQETIGLMDVLCNELFDEVFPDEVTADPSLFFQVHPYNVMDANRKMRDLNPSDIDKLVCISGMITRVSSVLPDLKEAFFSCASCSETVSVALDRGRIEEPDRCSACGQRRTMSIVHNRCIFSDKQNMKLQESPEDIPEGETPHTVSLVVFDSLVDRTKPGDRVVITGIFRAVPMRVSVRQTILKNVYRTFIDVLHVSRRGSRQRLGEAAAGLDVTALAGGAPAGDVGAAAGEVGAVGTTTLDEMDGEEAGRIASISQEREEYLRSLAQDPAIYDRLTASIAPSIFELEDVKKGILCQLFGGVNKEFANGGRWRGDINVLLVGDPAVSKSQILQYVHKIAPRGMYTSGKGSSAVGLTAYVTRDPDTREFVLESGALVLSDRGVCCIDEFDKMSDAARSILHEVMEQQTVSIAKAGIIASLNARTSILASANPVESRYNPRLSVVDNIMLPPTLLSRFDLIYLVLDKVDEAADRRLAKHLVRLYYRDTSAAGDNSNGQSARQEDSGNGNGNGNGNGSGNGSGMTTAELIPLDVLSQYIAFAKQSIKPVISDAAMKLMVDGYVDMRRLGASASSRKKIITATPRQLESLIRLSEALCRVRLKSVVEETEVKEALRLVRVAMQQSAVDPRTGQIDMDLLTTGHAASDSQEREALATELKALLASAREASFSVKELAARVGDGKVPVHLVRHALSTLEEEGIVSLGGENGSRVFKR